MVRTEKDDLSAERDYTQCEVERLEGRIAKVAATKELEVGNLEKELEAARTERDELSAERDSERRKSA